MLYNTQFIDTSKLVHCMLLNRHSSNYKAKCYENKAKHSLLFLQFNFSVYDVQMLDFDIPSEFGGKNTG